MRKSIKVSTILFAAVLSIASMTACGESNNNAASTASNTASTSLPAGSAVSLPFGLTSDGSQTSTQGSTTESFSSSLILTPSSKVDESSVPTVESSVPTVESSVPTVESSVPTVESSIPDLSYPQSSQSTSRITLREYFEQNGGQSSLDTLAQSISNNQMSAKIYFSGDDLVYDMTSTRALMSNLTAEQQETAKNTMIQAMDNYLDKNKSTLTSALEKAKTEYNIVDFNVQFIVRDSDGTVLYQRKI